MASSILVEVAYASKENQFLLEIKLDNPACVADAIQASGVLKEFPEIDLDSISTGIFSRPVSLQAFLNNGDRVEIYRPLEVDPKEARRLRAEANKAKESKAKKNPENKKNI